MNIMSQLDSRPDIDQSETSLIRTNEKPPTGLDNTLFGETIAPIQVNGQR